MAFVRPKHIARSVVALLVAAVMLLGALFVFQPSLFGTGKTTMSSKKLRSCFQRHRRTEH